MEKRKILFTAADGSVARFLVEIPGKVLNPPKFLLFRDKLYQYKGSGMGSAVPANFYHEVVDFMQLKIRDDNAHE